MLLAVVNINVSGQYKVHHLELGIGIWSTNEIINTLSDMIISSSNLEGATMKDGMSYGSTHVAYRYYTSEKFGIGAIAAYDHAYSKGFLNDSEIGKFYKRHYTLALEAEYAYVRTRIISLYGLAGAGGTLYTLNYKPGENATIAEDSSSKSYFTFQITPLALRLGNSFGFYAEAGIGYRGILNLGLFARF